RTAASPPVRPPIPSPGPDRAPGPGATGNRAAPDGGPHPAPGPPHRPASPCPARRRRGYRPRCGGGPWHSPGYRSPPEPRRQSPAPCPPASTPAAPGTSQETGSARGPSRAWLRSWLRFAFDHLRRQDHHPAAFDIHHGYGGVRERHHLGLLPRAAIFQKGAATIVMHRLHHAKIGPLAILGPKADEVGVIVFPFRG